MDTFTCDDCIVITIPLVKGDRGQSETLTPEKFHCVFKDSYKVFRKGQPKALGTAQIVTGLLVITLGLVQLQKFPHIAIYTMPSVLVDFCRPTDAHGLSKAAVSCICALITFLLLHVHNYIQCPAGGDALYNTKGGFHAIAGIPGIVCAADGILSLIHICSPLNPTSACRKGFLALGLNVQVTCNHQGHFTDIVTKWPEYTGRLYLVQSCSESAKDGVFAGGWLLGDSRRPLSEYLLIPVLNPEAVSEERYHTTQQRHTLL